MTATTGGEGEPPTCASCSRPFSEHGAPHDWDTLRLPSCPIGITGTYRPAAPSPSGDGPGEPCFDCVQGRRHTADLAYRCVEHSRPVMAKWRKRPVVVDAAQINFREEAASVVGVCTGGTGCKGGGPADDSWPHVHTLEGDHTWSPGDWLIRGVFGEFYFCKPDDFARTYEPIAAPPERAME